MSPVSNPRLIFNEVPKGFPVPGKTTVYDTTQTIDLDNVPLNGGVLVKTLYLSVDPYFRGRMRAPGTASYSEPFTLGEPIDGYGVGVVIRSERDGFNKGDYVLSPLFQHQAYNVWTDKTYAYVLKNEEKLPLSVYLGVAGMPGKTAQYGLKLVGGLEKGQTVYVSSGAGPVGSVAIQLAKAAGCRVIGSAGSSDKVEYMKSIGVDVAFNYKEREIGDILKEVGGVDVYWDNVGGKSLETVIDHCNLQARIICCGAISEYNSSEKYGVKNLMNIIAKRLYIRGVMVGDHEAKWAADFYATIPAMIKRGEIKYLEHVTEGLEHGGRVILEVQQGENNGKAIIKVADE